MANDYIERLAHILHEFTGCATPEGQIIDIEGFNEAIEELAYIVNKMELEIW